MSKVLSFSFFLLAILASCVSYDELIAQGKEHLDKGNIEEAKSTFEEALKKDSTRADAYYGLGYLLAEKCRNQHEGCEYAVNYFTKVIKIDSNFRHAFYNRANCFIELGKHEEALHDLNSSFSVAKEDADYHGNRAVCYLYLGDTLNAMSSYRKSVELQYSKRSDYLDRLFYDFRLRQKGE
jgi:tetratricopeptide (TPR) repeat protein